MHFAQPVRSPSDTLDPAWEQWLALVGLAAAEAEQPAWSGCVQVREARPVGAPLLHGSTVRVDSSRATALVRQLADRLGVVSIERVDPLALILGGLERDWDTLEGLASKLAIAFDTAAVLGEIAAMPVLIDAARALGDELSRTWQRGYCPVCG
ncbi:MAG TPA: hypothetical protein VFZ73_01120, partial [Gemmatimonadaceae bacterium]